MTRPEPFTIQLAGIPIRIEPLYEKTREYCKDYIVETPEPAEFSVAVDSEAIAYEQLRSDREAVKENRVPVVYPEEYLETLAVYRSIAEWMPRAGVVLFHGSVVAVDGKAYLFTARSGTGKSTHTRLWREYFGERAVMVNDDKPLLKVTKEGVFACGTPWDGKHHLNTNCEVPLAAICILKRDTENVIRQAAPAQVYPILLQQCYRPSDKETLERTLHLLDSIKEQVTCYSLRCNQDRQAAEVAYYGMNPSKRRE